MEWGQEAANYASHHGILHHHALWGAGRGDGMGERELVSLKNILDGQYKLINQISALGYTS